MARRALAVCVIVAVCTSCCSCHQSPWWGRSISSSGKSWARQLERSQLWRRHPKLLHPAAQGSRLLLQEDTLAEEPAASSASEQEASRRAAPAHDRAGSDGDGGQSTSSSSSDGASSGGSKHSARGSDAKDHDGGSSSGSNSKARRGAPPADELEDPSTRASWDAVPSYSSHYASDAERPNLCKVAMRRPAMKIDKPANFSAGAKDYVPFIGTSVVRDSQLMLMRLYYSIDFPVKWFVVVVGQHAAAGSNPIAYELRHMQEYPLEQVGLVVITCEHHPSVSESWNAVFQGFLEEPWGVYMARDTFWERGALAKLAPHGWRAAETGDVDVGFVTWTNMGPGEAVHNIFMMTNRSVSRFGLWDENIYPALCEDFDMFRRMEVMRPPMTQRRFEDVYAVHGRRTDKGYYPGAWLPDDPHVKEEKDLTHFTVHIRHGSNCNYWMRKWGCPSEAGDWMSQRGDCRFTTPFNKTVPVWYWHTSKALRARDRWLTVKEVRKEPLLKQLMDSRTNEVVFDVPKHYGEWGGYAEKSLCRLSGALGRIRGPDGRPMCL